MRSKKEFSFSKKVYIKAAFLNVASNFIILICTGALFFLLGRYVSLGINRDFYLYFVLTFSTITSITISNFISTYFVFRRKIILNQLWYHSFYSVGVFIICFSVYTIIFEQRNLPNNFLEYLALPLMIIPLMLFFGIINALGCFLSNLLFRKAFLNLEQRRIEDVLDY